MTDHLTPLATLLGREHWRIESITVRVHVLRMAVGGDWPGSIDDADAGLTDAVDRLRQEELARAVLTARAADGLGLEPEATLSQLLVDAPDDVARQLVVAADGLMHAIEAARTAASDAAELLHDAAYNRARGTMGRVVTPTRAAVLGRLLERVIPDSIERFLGLRVA